MLRQRPQGGPDTTRPRQALALGTTANGDLFVQTSEVDFSRILSRSNYNIDDPTAVCLPNGLTRQIPSPYAQQWIQTPTQLVILYEYMHFFRVIPIGAPNRRHDANIEKTWMGDTIAWWEGDTLVLDTAGLKEWMWDASHEPSRWHSDQLHVVERLTYTDPMTATYDIALDDPKIFTAPWTTKWGMKLHPTWQILEFVCEENNRCRAGDCKLSPEQEGQQ